MYYPLDSVKGDSQWHLCARQDVVTGADPRKLDEVSFSQPTANANAGGCDICDSGFKNSIHFGSGSVC